MGIGGALYNPVDMMHRPREHARFGEILRGFHGSVQVDLITLNSALPVMFFSSPSGD